MSRGKQKNTMSVAKTFDSSISKNHTSELSLIVRKLTIECEKISHNFNMTHVVERKK